MNAKLVVGTQWGDEGKAKFIDYLSKSIDIIVRYQGGANAGHTVKIGDETYIFHLIPSGILYPETICVLGNGVVIDPQAFIEELDYLKERGFEQAEERIIISDLAHIVLPIHRSMDKAAEELAGEKKIGTTLRGIGMCYGDKIGRVGLRIADILDESKIADRVESILEAKGSVLQKIYNIHDTQKEAIQQEILSFSQRVKPLVRNTSLYLNQALEAGKRVLLEGAQGTGLDVDFGTYPYVTSSNTTTGGAITGSGISLQHIGDVIGICKAYISRVGEGPFPTELHGEEGEKLRRIGSEFGATTGRPRRCGWFDVELLRHAARVNGLTGLALTKIDIFSEYKEVKIGVAYKKAGERLEAFPATGYDQLEVEYETLPGWETDIRNARKLSDLPKACRAYIDRVVELVDVPVKFISVGPGREDTIVV